MNPGSMEVPVSHGEGGEGLDDTHETVGLHDELPVHQTIFARVPGLAEQVIRIGGFVAEDRRGGAVGEAADNDHEERRQDLQKAEEDVGHDRPEFRDGASQKQIRDRLLQIVEDNTAILHSFHHCIEGVEEDHIRGFDVGSVADGDTDVRGFEGWGVVHAVACHADEFITSLQFTDDAEFLVGGGAGKDDLVVFAELVPLGGLEGDKFGAADYDQGACFLETSALSLRGVLVEVCDALAG